MVGIFDSIWLLLFIGTFKAIVASLEISLKGEERRIPRTPITRCPDLPPFNVKALWMIRTVRSGPGMAMKLKGNVSTCSKNCSSSS